MDIWKYLAHVQWLNRKVSSLILIGSKHSSASIHTCEICLDRVPETERAHFWVWKILKVLEVSHVKTIVSLNCITSRAITSGLC